jgi:DNA replication protein DnaC
MRLRNSAAKADNEWARTYSRLREKLEDGSIIVLLGNRGTGKTQMAVDLLSDICDQLHSVRYLKMMDLFREIRCCYRKDGPNEVSVVDAFCKVWGLVLDEAHERSDSEWENRTLTNIIDRRYDNNKTTILVSNMAAEPFAKAIGDSAISRIRECGEVVICNWPSFRK